MRIGAISDLHGNITSLEAVIKDINMKSVDSIICCGDLVAFGPRPVEVLDLLDSLKNIQIIRGNTDRWLEIVHSGVKKYEEKIITKVESALKWTIDKLGSRAESYFKHYPAHLNVGSEGLKTFVRHGDLVSDTTGIWPESDLGLLGKQLEEAKCDIFLCGHTHVPFTKKIKNTTIANAGSTALPFDSIPKPSWILLEIEDKNLKTQIFRVNYNMETVISELKHSGMPMADVFAERLRNARM